jgi:phospholipid-translocating ATPase
MKAIFSALFFMATISLYPGILMIGYDTWYKILKFPVLYSDPGIERSLSTKKFCMWTLISIYQASVIMMFSILAFESSMTDIVSITFTALILCELSNISLQIHHWKILIVAAELLTFLLYVGSMIIFPTYFSEYTLF